MPRSLTRRLKGASRRNSRCDTADLGELDWSQWWSDDTGGLFYLHVARADGTSHRVFCRHSQKPRLALRNGVLEWLV